MIPNAEDLIREIIMYLIMITIITICAYFPIFIIPLFILLLVFIAKEYSLTEILAGVAVGFVVSSIINRK